MYLNDWLVKYFGSRNQPARKCVCLTSLFHRVELVVCVSYVRNNAVMV